MQYNTIYFKLELATISILIAGCTPRLYHFDGRPFIPYVPIMGIENGWVTVDSCALGFHALVELEVEARKRVHVQTWLKDLAFGFDSARFQKPKHVRIKGPFSRPREFKRSIEDLEYRVGQEVHSPWGPHNEEYKQVYVVRAEFTLNRLPRAGDLLVIVYRGRKIGLKWP
ncbi:MAG: hypothetical protein ACE5NG_11050 [bacterium]